MHAHERGRFRGRVHRFVAVLATAFVATGLLALTGPAQQAQAAELPPSITEGGFIISDKEFFASGSMTQAQIQTFLNQRVPNCVAGATCLKDYRESFAARPADQYCKALSAGTNLIAAAIIHRVASACGINPKVLLVMLQKEQSLVTLTNPSKLRFDRAMGFACPDSGPNNSANCNTAHYGFANQVYRGARQLQVYTKNPNSFNYKAGQVNTIKWHPSSSCGTSKVFIQNQATANLYIYTPYRANIAALAAGWGTGDKCSAYGNRNFYNYYVQWFAPGASSSNGAPAQINACTQPASAEIATRNVSATVTSANLNVRRAPTTLCTQNVTTLAKGQKVTITGQYGAWSRATVGGNTVWISSEFLDSGSTPAPVGTTNPCAAPAAASITKASGEYIVNSASLNARKAPSTSCTTGSTTLKSGAKVTRVGTYGVWWQVEAASDTWWVHSDFLKAAPKPSTATPKPKETPMVTSSAVNLRASNSTASKSLRVLPKGTKVSVTGSKGVWRSVKVGSQTGWVHGDYLKNPPKAAAPKSATPKATPMVTSSAVNLRASNSTASKSLRVLPKGTKVSVTGSKGVWRSVKVGSQTGWVHGDYLKNPPKATTTKPATTKATTRTVTSNALNLRASASTSAKVVTVLKKGTKVTVTETKGVWHKVKVGTRTGWVHGTYLK